MLIGQGIHMLNISAAMMGRIETIHPTFLWDHQDLVLIDTGYPGQFALIQEQLSNIGFSVQDVNKIIITHQDLDHIGSLPAVIQHSKRAPEVFASEIESLISKAIQGLSNYRPRLSRKRWRRCRIPCPRRGGMRLNTRWRTLLQHL